VAPGLFPHGRGGIYDASQPGKLTGVINAASTMILEFVQKGETHPIGVNFSPAVILSVAKDLSLGSTQILRYAQDDRWRGSPLSTILPACVIEPRRKTPGFSHGDRRRVPRAGAGVG